MVSGLGLSPFKALEAKPASKPSERKSSDDSALFSSGDKAKDTSASNSSSVSQQKPLDKSSEKKVENKKESDFSKKLSEASEKDSDNKVEAKSSDKTESTDKSAKSEKKPEVKKDPKQTISSNVNVADYPQMQMLAVPTQMQAVVAKPEESATIDAVTEKTAMDISKLPQQAQPVARFMQSMNEYFGIKPEKIISALNQLPPDIMLKSPHEGMTALFEKLEMQPRDFTKAQIFFNEMVQDLEKAPTGQTMAPAPMPVMPQNAKVAAQTSKKSTLDALIEQKISRRAIEPQNYMNKDAAPVAGAAFVNPQAPQVAQQPQTANLSQIFHVDPMVQQQTMIANSVAVDKLQSMDPNMRIQDVKINPDKITEPMFVDGQDAAAQLQMKNMLAKNQESEKDKEDEKDGLKDKLGTHNPMLQGQELKPEQFAQNLNQKLEGTLSAAVTPQVRQENIQKLTENAQTLITKGGGEMKVQLKPEGMGDVLLKVKVQDGQVGIQMVTESHDAKKLIESGFNDLKMNLAEHKLSLNHLKVDVSDQMNNNMNNNNFNQDARRDEAREFMSQFRDYNQSMRQQFTTPGAVKAYGRGMPQAPTVSPTSARGDDGRLYLVA